MSLSEILAARRERSLGRLKPEHAERLERHIRELRESGAADRTVRVGDAAPTFALPGVTGKLVRSPDLLARGPLIVSFFRGKWCPYCVAELEALNEIVPELEAAGGALVTISPERPTRSAEIIAEKGLRYEILFDAGNRVAELYRVAYVFPPYLEELYRDVFKHDIAAYNDDTVWKLPIPARFVIDREGVVREALVDPDYRHRPEPRQSLEVALGTMVAS